MLTAYYAQVIITVYRAYVLLPFQFQRLGTQCDGPSPMRRTSQLMLVGLIYVKKCTVYTNSVRVTVVGDIKLHRSPLQNSNFIMTLSLGFVLTMCNVMVKLEFCNGDLCSFTSPTTVTLTVSINCAVFNINICCFIAARNNSNPIKVNS